jgi:hypothetical protein
MMKLRQALVIVIGLSLMIFVLNVVSDTADSNVSAEAEENDAVGEARIDIALSATPLVLRDGRQATADVVRIGFDPATISLSEEAREPLEVFLTRIARECMLSAQIIGVASEYETVPRPVVDAHLLALQRADTIAEMMHNSGLPMTAVSSVWTVESGSQVPASILWVFSSKGGPECAKTGRTNELTEMPAAKVAESATADEVGLDIIGPPMPRPQHDHSTRGKSSSMFELTLTFADNSSYLDDQEIARLRQFTSALAPTCDLTLRATVAGGADSHYAAWLAERRMGRVAKLLGDLIGTMEMTELVLVPNDASRQVIVAISNNSDCNETQDSTAEIKPASGWSRATLVAGL